MRIFAPLKLLLTAAVVVFLIFQVWVFLRPAPQPLSPGEQRAVRAAVESFARELAAAAGSPARVAVLSLWGDDSGEITVALRERVAAARGFSIETRSLPARLISDLGRAMSEANTVGDILKAGEKIEVDVVVAGRVVSLTEGGGGARAELQLHAYDTRQGAWVVGQRFAGEWSPGWLGGLRGRVDGWPFWQGLTLWLVVVALLPWLSTGLTVRAAQARSNFWSGVLVLGFGSINLFLAALLIGFSLSGFWPWLGFMAAAILGVAYPWWVCERVAGAAR